MSWSHSIKSAYGVSYTDIIDSLFTLIRFGREVVEESEDEKEEGTVKMDDLFSAHEEPHAETGLTIVENKTKEPDDKKKEQEDIDRQNDDETTVKLRHASLGDYLRSNDIKRTRLTARLSEGEFELASLTMQIVCDPNKDLSDIWEYAAFSWLQHLIQIDEKSLSAPEIRQIALRIALVLTSPESVPQLIAHADYDSLDWEYSDSAGGAKYRDVVLKWLVKAHGLGLTTDKYSDLPKLLSTTGVDVPDLNAEATNETGKKCDDVNEPNTLSPKETTAATTAILVSPSGSSAEPKGLDHGLTAQLESMMTRSVAAAVQQVLKRLKNSSTGQFIFDESILSGFGDDLELPVASGSTQDRFNIGADAAPSYLELEAILAEHRLRELISKYSFVTNAISPVLIPFQQRGLMKSSRILLGS